MAKLTPSEIAARLTRTARDVLTGNHERYSDRVFEISCIALARKGLMEINDEGKTRRTELGDRVAEACFSPETAIITELREATVALRKAFKEIADLPLTAEIRKALQEETIGLVEECNILRVKLHE